MLSEPLHPINVVAQRTGLSVHVIRVWERRYGAVKPRRLGKNRRAYSSGDIHRLGLLRGLTNTGQSISFVAHLGTRQLERLAAGPAPAAVESPPAAPEDSRVERTLAAVRRLDAGALCACFAEAELQLGLQGTLQRLIAPLAERLGDLWREGTISAAHEHFASGALRTFLGNAVRPFAAADHAPVLVVATPHGQLHELGALMAAAFASNLGWRVTYLGPSLAPADIAGVAKQSGARLVALSLVYPHDDPGLEDDLRKLRKLLPSGVDIVVGGRAASAYHKALGSVNALRPASLDDFGRLLDDVRLGSPSRLRERPARR